ncbi:hypothetical protein [Latilactobacillus fuchuensis]|uniref:Uncharacterized protein n=1 Tax=Latilactobacillus fuchuensis TaxID=164393 RepID=A0A2N9DW77_9LACO|nr:hypothetical protein [Latilactobacillus fuchuensis]MCP8858231.1 hypothetical protein [Latilactobacillus fuchuensis]SPC38799.1 conserved membrane hypothetical protein [Latilactobacillus fuchuensis]
MHKSDKTVTPTAISSSIRTRFFALQMIVIVVLGGLTVKIVSGFSPLMTDSEILNNTILTALASTVVVLAIWYLSYKLIAHRIMRQVMDKDLEESYIFKLSHAASSLSLHIVYFISILVIVWLMMSSQNVRNDLTGLQLFKGDAQVVKMVDDHSLKQIKQFYQPAGTSKTSYLGSNQDQAYFKVNQDVISLPLAKVQFEGQDNANSTGKMAIQCYKLKNSADKRYLKQHVYLIKTGLPTVPITKMYQHYTPQSSTSVPKLDIE